MISLSTFMALCGGNTASVSGFLSKRASNVDLWCFIWHIQTVEQTVKLPMIRDSMMLIWKHNLFVSWPPYLSHLQFIEWQLYNMWYVPRIAVKSLIYGAPNPTTWMFLVSTCSCLCPIHWNQVLSQEWRCSWSSAGRRCSKYIWVINKFITY